MKTLIIFLSLIFVTGCSSMVSPKVSVDVKHVKSENFVSTATDYKYPGYMAAAGNIYSCRYGIYYKSMSDYSVPKDLLFISLLVKHNPTLLDKKIQLKQFDVYHNKRVYQLGSSGKMAITAGLGIAGSVIPNAMLDVRIAKANKGFSDTRLNVYKVPTQYPFSNKSENAVGCDGKNEGEYYSSRVNGGNDILVSWYTFTVDGEVYKYRTTYELTVDNPLDKKAMQNVMAEGIESSLQYIAKDIK